MTLLWILQAVEGVAETMGQTTATQENRQPEAEDRVRAFPVEDVTLPDYVEEGTEDEDENAGPVTRNAPIDPYEDPDSLTLELNLDAQPE